MESAFSQSHQHNYRSSISYCNKAAKLNPNSPIPYVLKCVCKNQLNDYRGVLSDGQIALLLKPTQEDLGQLYLNIGFAYYKLGYKSTGCSYMSKAGNIGVSQAYDFINEYCN